LSSIQEANEPHSWSKLTLRFLWGSPMLFVGLWFQMGTGALFAPVPILIFFIPAARFYGFAPGLRCTPQKKDSPGGKPGLSDFLD
jgi:hypothetical protein